MASFDKDTLALGLKVVSTTALGLYAGQSLYINAVEVPANLDHEPEQSLSNWQRNFHHASHFAPKVSILGLTAALGHYLVTRGTDKEDIAFLLGQMLVQTNAAISFGIIMPVNKKLQDEEEIKKKGGEYTRGLLQQWNKLHGLRTIVGLSAFGFCVYCIAKGPN